MSSSESKTGDAPSSNVPSTPSNISSSSGEGSASFPPKIVYTAKGVPIDMEESMYLEKEVEGDGYILYRHPSTKQLGMVYLENPRPSSSSAARPTSPS